MGKSHLHKLLYRRMCRLVLQNRAGRMYLTKSNKVGLQYYLPTIAIIPCRDKLDITKCQRLSETDCPVIIMKGEHADMPICDWVDCNKVAVWSVCVKEEDEPVALLRHLCDKHINKIPSYHQMLLTMFDIEAERAERRLELQNG